MILASQIAAGIIVAWLLIRFARLFATLAVWIVALGLVVGGIVIAAERISDEMDRIRIEERAL